MKKSEIGNPGIRPDAERQQRFPKPWVARSNRAGVTGSNNRRKPSNHREFLAVAMAAGCSDIEARGLERDLLRPGALSGNDARAKRAIRALVTRQAESLDAGRLSLGQAVNNLLAVGGAS